MDLCLTVHDFAKPRLQFGPGFRFGLGMAGGVGVWGPTRTQAELQGALSRKYFVQVRVVGADRFCSAVNMVCRDDTGA